MGKDFSMNQNYIKTAQLPQMLPHPFPAKSSHVVPPDCSPTYFTTYDLTEAQVFTSVRFDKYSEVVSRSADSQGKNSLKISTSRKGNQPIDF